MRKTQKSELTLAEKHLADLLFKLGNDTNEIASVLQSTEAAVYNALYHMKRNK